MAYIDTIQKGATNYDLYSPYDTQWLEIGFSGGTNRFKTYISWSRIYNSAIIREYNTALPLLNQALSLNIPNITSIEDIQSRYDDYIASFYGSTQVPQELYLVLVLTCIASTANATISGKLDGLRLTNADCTFQVDTTEDPIGIILEIGYYEHLTSVVFSVLYDSLDTNNKPQIVLKVNDVD